MFNLGLRGAGKELRNLASLSICSSNPSWRHSSNQSSWAQTGWNLGTAVTPPHPAKAQARVLIWEAPNRDTSRAL